MALVRKLLVYGNEETVDINLKVLPSKDHHVRQVTPDRHSVTVRNRDKIRSGTWNVRTL